MGRDPEDYLIGGSDDSSADMTADASLLGYLQLANDPQTGSLIELKKTPRLTGDSDEAE